MSRATALTEDLRPAVLARAVGKASLLLFCLGLAAVVGSFAAGRWDPQYDSTLPVALRLGPCLLVMAVGITSWLIRRRIKALHRLAGLVLVVGGVALVAATVLALRPFPSPVTTGSASNTTCVPLLDAWQTTVPQPSAADTAAFASVYDGATGVNLSDPVARAQYLQQRAAIRATPAFRRAYRYYAWRLGPGPCASQAQRDVGLALGLLVLGGLAMTGMSAFQACRSRFDGAAV